MLKNKSNKLFTIGILVIGIIAAVILFSALITRGYFKSRSFIGGDEPHYVMMVDSLLKDKDFNLKNDYELSRSIQYYGEELFPHLAPIIDYKNSNNWQSIHTIGLPLLMYVPYKIAGVLGVRIFLIILQLSTIIVFYFILKKYIKDKIKVLIGLLLLISCSLFWQNLGGIFPDLLLVLFVGLSILLFGKKSILQNIELTIVVLIASITHSKAIALLIPIYIAHVLYLIKDLGIVSVLRHYWASFGLLILGFTAYAIFLLNNYGVFLPSQLYGEKGQLFSANMYFNLLAILFDRVKGLIVYYPILLISGPYLYRAFTSSWLAFKNIIKNKKINKENYLLVSIIIGLFILGLTQLGFDDWSGSFSPNGRYMLVFIFMIIFLIAKYINLKNVFEKIILALFLSFNFIVTFLTVSRIDVYFDTGKESFLSQQLLLNSSLPLFSLSVKNNDLEKIIYSSLILLIVILFNLALINLYDFKSKLKNE
jgi:hypothetical protein